MSVLPSLVVIGIEVKVDVTFTLTVAFTTAVVGPPVSVSFVVKSVDVVEGASGYSSER